MIIYMAGADREFSRIKTGLFAGTQEALLSSYYDNKTKGLSRLFKYILKRRTTHARGTRTVSKGA